jgi:ABC-type molybdate transport system substrate-binding protein
MPTPARQHRTVRGVALILALSTATAQAAPPAARLQANEAQYPPWQNGENNDAAKQGLVFTVPPADSMADFHGSLDNPALVLYASGNYYFAMRDMVRAFGDAYPAYRGRVFYETLPPGLLLKQMAAGGTITSGNLTFTVKPDVMMAEQRASLAWVQDGKLTAPVVSFATNDLTIMVSAGNPAHIAGLADLARPDLAIVMPNPTFEGVAKQIRASLVKAGGEILAQAVYNTKVADGTTVLTRIHHRQTPMLLMQGLGHAGVTWTSEAVFQEQQGHPIAHITIPAEQNTRAIYSAAMVAGAAHADAARAWLTFIRSDAAFATLSPFGFQRFAQ